MEKIAHADLTIARRKLLRVAFVVLFFTGLFSRFAYTGTSTTSGKLAPIEVDLNGIANEDLDFWRACKFFVATFKEEELLEHLGYENELKKDAESAEAYEYLLIIVKFESGLPPKYPTFRLVINEGHFETIDSSVPKRLGHPLPLIFRVEELGSLYTGPRVLKKKTVFNGFPKIMVSSLPDNN